MKLKGVLDFSLGNFLCLRGFAPMGDLYDLSEADPGFQRDLLTHHEKQMVAFLRDGEFLFFPEVILATTLSPEETDSEVVNQLFQKVRAAESFANLKFPDYRIACKVQKTKSSTEARAFDAGLPPFYVPGAVRVGSAVTDGPSGRRSAAEADRGTVAPYSAGVRYPNEL